MGLCPGRGMRCRFASDPKWTITCLGSYCSLMAWIIPSLSVALTGSERADRPSAVEGTSLASVSHHQMIDAVKLVSSDRTRSSTVSPGTTPSATTPASATTTPSTSTMDTHRASAVWGCCGCGGAPLSRGGAAADIARRPAIDSRGPLFKPVQVPYAITRRRSSRRPRPRPPPRGRGSSGRAGRCRETARP